MRQFDLSPLYRSTIGFDRLFNMIDQAAGLETMPSYPPYNIERTGENAYRISVAVAGFAATDLFDRNQGKYPYTSVVRGNARARAKRRSRKCSIRGLPPARSSAASSSPITSM